MKTDGREERKSVTDARMYRQVPKNKAFSVGNKRIDHLRYLLDRKVLMNTEGEYRAHTKREVTICKLYPHMALAYYISGPEKGTKHKFYVGLSVADLIEAGVLNYTHGYPEVRV